VKPHSLPVALRARREEPQLFFDCEEPYTVFDLPVVDLQSSVTRIATTNFGRRNWWKPSRHAENTARFEARFCGSARAGQGFAHCARRWRGLDAGLRASHEWQLSKPAEVSTEGTCQVSTVAHSARSRCRIDTVSRCSGLSLMTLRTNRFAIWRSTGTLSTR
jgi:hypothetical protein